MTLNNNSHNNIIYPAYRLFMDHHIELAFQGDITSVTTDALINIFENLLYNKDAPVKIQKRAFYILVEALQNVVRHQSLPKGPLSGSSGSLLFQYIGGHFIFTLKNLVEESQIPAISGKIDALNKLGKNELNKYYKKILKNEILSDKGGAGLGLIEIARKSENILSYDFLSAGGGLSWFFFNIMVADRGKEQELPVGKGIDVAKEIHHLLDGSAVWFILREEYPAIFPSGMMDHVAKVMGCRKDDPNEENFLSLLKVFSGLCAAASVIQQSEGKKPCLIYFARDKDSLSVYTGMPVTATSSDKTLAFLNDLFAGQLNKRSLGRETEIPAETLEKLMQIPGYLPKPPRIILQDIPSAEKFILLKFTY